MHNLNFIIEKGTSGFWGRTACNGNLYNTQADDLKQVTQNLLQQLHDFEELPAENISFTYQYDMQALFEEFSFLKQSKVAETAGINPGLLRQYASGAKYPSAAQAERIIQAFHQLGEKMTHVAFYAAHDI